MKEYNKIETIFKRDETTKKLKKEWMKYGKDRISIKTFKKIW